MPFEQSIPLGKAPTQDLHVVLLCSHEISLFSLRLQPIERKPLVYQPDSAMSSHSKDLDNLPDEFFEVTVDDIRKRFAMLKSER